MMFKHANLYVPGAAVYVQPAEGEKTASTRKLAAIESVDPDHDKATVKYPDGDTEEVKLEQLEIP